MNDAFPSLAISGSAAASNAVGLGGRRALRLPDRRPVCGFSELSEHVETRPDTCVHPVRHVRVLPVFRQETTWVFPSRRMIAISHNSSVVPARIPKQRLTRVDSAGAVGPSVYIAESS